MSNSLVFGDKRRQAYDLVDNHRIVLPDSRANLYVQDYSRADKRDQMQINRQPVKLCPVPWYHGPISREEAETLLQPYNDGFFLIRESVTFKGGFTLSVCCDKLVQHYKIIYSKGRYTIDEEIFFDMLEDLVDHYANDADGIVHQLVSYPPKSGVPIYPPVLDQFEKKSWVVNFMEVQIGQQLGAGDFATVYHASMRGVDIAAKCVKQNSSMSYFGLKEASMMTILNHVNLVRLFGISMNENNLYLLCEYLPNGSLVDFLRSRGKNKIDLAQLMIFSLDICSGMTHLEEKLLVHRDLAARNILLDNQCRAKIADFGHCRESNSQEHKGRVPIKWTAPEAIRHNNFTPASDMWSFGVLLWEMFTFGRLPYTSMQVKDVLEYLDDGHRLLIPEDCPTQIYDLMRSMWHFRPELRPSFVMCLDKLKEIFQVLLPNLPLPPPTEAAFVPPSLS